MAGRFEIAVNRRSGVSLRQQLAEQIVYLIATGKLKPGERLPSVRELARRLKVHHNTVSEAYQELVRRTWLVGRRGSRLIVCGRDGGSERRRLGLDDVMNEAIRISREQGYSLQEVRQRVRQRLLTEPPDHILVVEEEPGLRRLLEEEIRRAGKWPVEGCSREDLARSPGTAIGALLATPGYALADVERFARKEFPAIPLAFSVADAHLRVIRKLREASVIAVVSVSEAFLAAARSLFVPAIGNRHTLIEFRLPLGGPRALAGADLVFCDSLAIREIKRKNCVPYCLIDEASMQYLLNAMESYRMR